MLSNANCGWCDFDLCGFHATPSYLTDIPFDLTECFINYLIQKQSVCSFDCEGSEFMLVLSYNDAYIINNAELVEVYKLDIHPLEIAQMFIDDTTKNLEDWVVWDCAFFHDEEDKEERRDSIIRGLKIIEAGLANKAGRSSCEIGFSENVRWKYLTS